MRRWFEVLSIAAAALGASAHAAVIATLNEDPASLSAGETFSVTLSTDDSAPDFNGTAFDAIFATGTAVFVSVAFDPFFNINSAGQPPIVQVNGDETRVRNISGSAFAFVGGIPTQPEQSGAADLATITFRLLVNDPVSVRFEGTNGLLLTNAQGQSVFDGEALVEFNPVPVPPGAVLFATGLGALAVRRLRRS